MLTYPFNLNHILKYERYIQTNLAENVKMLEQKNEEQRLGSVPPTLERSQYLQNILGLFLNVREVAQIAQDYTLTVFKDLDPDEQKEIIASKNFQEYSLVGADLRGADLRGANLRGADLMRADLMGADLRGANLRGADLKCAHLGVANLTRANLTRAHLEGAHLKDAYLEGAYLEGAYLEGAYLVGACLRGACLKGAHLESAHLEGADLEGADLKYAHLEDAYLGGARLNGAHLEGAQINLTSALFFLVVAQETSSDEPLFLNLKMATASQFQKKFGDSNFSELIGSGSRNRLNKFLLGQNVLPTCQNTCFTILTEPVIVAALEESPEREVTQSSSELIGPDSRKRLNESLSRDVLTTSENNCVTIPTEPVIAAPLEESPGRQVTQRSKVARFFLVFISTGAILTLAVGSVLFNTWNSLSPAVRLVVIIADLLISAVAGLIAVRISFPSSANAGAVQPDREPLESLLGGGNFGLQNPALVLASPPRADQFENKKEDGLEEGLGGLPMR
jgi:uncharacterized protein YjbI with pentapeptide repeats